MHSKTQGLVLRETNYKETDKILTVLTRDMGKRTVKARGCRRKGSRLAASAQLLVYSDMTLFEYRDYTSLNEAESLEQFWGIRRDIELLALSAYFAEVTEAVAEEGITQPELLSLILNSIYALDKLAKPRVLVKAAFELRLMCLAGYEPLLDACAQCGEETPGQPLLNLSDGVLCCARCIEEMGGGNTLPLPGGALDALRHIACGNPKRLFSFALDPVSLAALGAVTEGFLLTQLDRSFRTLDFYKELTFPAKELS
jgi:DNA repair protein RecO (recombination protein O)